MPSLRLVFGIHLSFYVLVMSTFLLALHYRDAGYLTLHGKMGDDSVAKVLFPDMDLDSKTQRSLFYVMIICMLSNWLGCLQAVNKNDPGYRRAMRLQCILIHGLQPLFMLGMGHLKLSEAGAPSWAALHSSFALMFLLAKERKERDGPNFSPQFAR